MRIQATPEEYQQFTRLDEQLTANEIVAFRLKAIAELEEEEALQLQELQSLASLPDPHQQHRGRRTWGQWLLRRDPSTSASFGALWRFWLFPLRKTPEIALMRIKAPSSRGVHAWSMV